MAFNVGTGKDRRVYKYKDALQDSYENDDLGLFLFGIFPLFFIPLVLLVFGIAIYSVWK